MLKGKRLLDRIAELNNLPKTDLARACGYVTHGKKRPRTNFTAFYEALLEAKGVNLEDLPSGSKGRQASFRARVQGNGNVMIGAAYTKRMGLEPGTEFEIKLGRKQITLLPITKDEDEE